MRERTTNEHLILLSRSTNDISASIFFTDIEDSLLRYARLSKLETFRDLARVCDNIRLIVVDMFRKKRRFYKLGNFVDMCTHLCNIAAMAFTAHILESKKLDREITSTLRRIMTLLQTLDYHRKRRFYCYTYLYTIWE